MMTDRQLTQIREDAIKAGEALSGIQDLYPSLDPTGAGENAELLLDVRNALRRILGSCNAAEVEQKFHDVVPTF